MNAAYSYGGPALVIKTFKQVTGLPINGWIEINFSGFWHVVNILGGVYLPIDHKYFVPASADYKSINLEPGYQLVRGKQALNYRALPARRVGRLRAYAAPAAVPQGGAAPVEPLERRPVQGPPVDQGDHRPDQVQSELAEEDPAARRSGLPGQHVQGLPGSPRGREPDDQRCSVRRRHPGRRSRPSSTSSRTRPSPRSRRPVRKIGKKMFQVRVYNGSGIAGLATTAASQLTAQGYNTTAVADALEFPDKVTAVYAPKRPPVAGRRDSRDDVAVERAHRQARAGQRGRHQCVRGVVLRRHHPGPDDRRPASADAGEEPEGRLGHVAAVRPEDAAQAGGSHGVVARVHLLRVAQLLDRDDRRQAPGRIGRRRPDGAIRLLGHPGDALAGSAADRPSQLARRGSTGAPTCFSIRATTCTWWPGRSTGRCTGCSTPWTTNSRTILCWAWRRPANP